MKPNIESSCWVLEVNIGQLIFHTPAYSPQTVTTAFSFPFLSLSTNSPSFPLYFSLSLSYFFPVCNLLAPVLPPPRPLARDPA